MAYTAFETENNPPRPSDDSEIFVDITVEPIEQTNGYSWKIRDVEGFPFVVYRSELRQIADAMKAGLAKDGALKTKWFKYDNKLRMLCEGVTG